MKISDKVKSWLPKKKEVEQKEDIDHTITQKDLDNNPGLEKDVKVGDEVTLSVGESVVEKEKEEKKDDKDNTPDGEGGGKLATQEEMREEVKAPIREEDIDKRTADGEKVPSFL